jgi:23S rRNA pseudouridine1911/1915/1917 synthase
VKRVAAVVGAEEAGLRLEALVARALRADAGEPLPRSLVRRLVMAGAVRRKGVALRRPGLPVEAGWRIEIALDETRLKARPKDVDFVLRPADVLFEDAWLVAVAKPAGLASVPTADPSRPSLAGAVEAWLRGRGRRGRLAVHQRLDRETSGVVLFAHDPRANAGLAAAFASHAIEKAYAALVARPRSAVPDAFHRDTPVDGRPARTEFRVRERLAGGLVLEARPRTGRKHQIRIHLAEAGLPILGDSRYGGPAAARSMLHAERLELAHPVTAQRLRIECPPPADFRAAQEALSAADRRPLR